MTKKQLKNLDVGDVLGHIGPHAGMWKVVSKPRKWSGSEFFVDVDVFSEKEKDEGWCWFTLSTNREDLNEFHLFAKSKYPEYYL